MIQMIIQVQHQVLEFTQYLLIEVVLFPNIARVFFHPVSVIPAFLSKDFKGYGIQKQRDTNL